MTIAQGDKLNMYYGVKNICERYRSSWASSGVFAMVYNLWLAKISLIESNRDAQMVETTGATADKMAKRLLMEAKAGFIVKRMLSYANATNNFELMEGVRYTSTNLRLARDTDVIGICNIILAKATLHASALVAYGVSEALIADLSGAIATFSAGFAKPNLAKSATKTATSNLVRLFKEADDLLVNRLDFDIELFRELKPDFYSEYKSIRHIVRTGNMPSAVMGNASVLGSGQPLEGVLFSFTLEAKRKSRVAVKPVLKKTATKGNFRIAHLPEGCYSVLASKIGFKEQLLSVFVVKGETAVVKVAME